MTQFGRFSVLEPRKKAGMAENRGMCESGRNGVEDWESEPQDREQKQSNQLEYSYFYIVLFYTY